MSSSHGRTAAVRRGVICLLCLVGPWRVACAAGQVSPGPPEAAAPADNGTWYGFSFSSLTSTRSLVTLGVAGVAAIWTWKETDERFSLLQDALNDSQVDPVLDAGNLYGSGWIIGGSALGLAAIGHFADKPSLVAFGTDLGRAFVYSGAAAWVLKLSVDRKRPSGGPHSFPSGHAASAFSIVPVVWHHAGWVAGTGALVAATATGLGRMEESRHYLSDVIAGAALGLVVGWGVIDARHETALGRHLVASGNRVGLAWRF